MMTLTPGRIFEENTEEALASALVQTTVLTSVGVWSEWPPHKCLLLDNNQYLQFLTPWVEDSVALLAPPASPWETNTAISWLPFTLLICYSVSGDKCVFSTCRDAETSCPHRRWKDLVQLCPEDKEKNQVGRETFNDKNTFAFNTAIK